MASITQVEKKYTLFGRGGLEVVVAGMGWVGWIGAAGGALGWRRSASVLSNPGMSLKRA
jgi:hypothetical protein